MSETRPKYIAAPPEFPRRRVTIEPAKIGWRVHAGLTRPLWALTLWGAHRLARRWGVVDAHNRGNHE